MWAINKRLALLALTALASPLATSAIQCGIDLSCALLCLDDTNITTYADGTMQQSLVAAPTATVISTHATAINTSFWQRISSLTNTSTLLSVRPDAAPGEAAVNGSLSFITLQATVEPSLLNCSMKTGVCTKICKYDQNIETTIVNFNYLMDFFDSLVTPRLTTIPCASRGAAYASFVSQIVKPGLPSLLRKYSHFDFKSNTTAANVTSLSGRAVDKFVAFVNDTNKPFALAASVCNADSAMKRSANLGGCAITSNVLSYSLYARQCACNITDNGDASIFEPATPHMKEIHIPRTNSPWHGWLYTALAGLERAFLPKSHQHAYYTFGGNSVYTLYDDGNLTSYEDCMGANGGLCLDGNAS